MIRNKACTFILFCLLLGSLNAEGQNLEEAAQEVANQISLSLIEEGKKNIAIVPFTDLYNARTSLGEAFSEELYNRLFRLRQGKFEIVERAKVGAIWKEQREFSDQWLLDNLKGFSQILGADAVLVGTHLELDDYHRVNARLLAVPSGQFLATASTRMQKIAGLSGTGGPSSSDPKQKSDPLGARIATSVGEGFQVDLLSCKLTGDSLACDFLATSKDRDQGVWLRSVRLIERSAKQIPASSLAFGVDSSKGRQVHAELVRGIPMRGRMVFEGVDASLARNGISLIEMSFDPLKAQFRDVEPD